MSLLRRWGPNPTECGDCSDGEEGVREPRASDRRRPRGRLDRRGDRSIPWPTRRRFLVGAAAGAVGATAGCLDRIETVVDDVEEPEASGEVYGGPERFTVDVEAGEELFVSTTVTREGSGGQGEMTLSDPDGTEVDSARFSLSVGTARVLEAEADGTHVVTVDPRGDGQVRLRVSIGIVEEDG